MSKMLLIVVAVAIGAVVLFMPKQGLLKQSSLESPPIVVEQSAGQVATRMRPLSFDGFMKAEGFMDHVPGFMSARTEWISDDEAKAEFVIAGEPVLRVTTKVRSLGGSRSEVDVKAELPDSRFSHSPDLHPYDLKAMVAFADMLATEYLGSAIEQRHMITGDDMQLAMEQRAGFTTEEGRAFGDRLKAAFQDAYAPELTALKTQLENSERQERFPTRQPNPSAASPMMDPRPMTDPSAVAARSGAN
jgi:hypothetical protein